jgi:hypothetical protein
MGAPDWGQAGQTFDGIRWIRPAGEGRLEVVFLKIREGSSPAFEHDADFWGASYLQTLGGLGTLEILGVHDRANGPRSTKQYTLGGIWKGSPASFTYRVQAMTQFGKRWGEEVSASLFAAAATWNAPGERGFVTLWYDRLSGDEDPVDDEIRAFSTLYGARNRFYGRADYFTNIPVQTGGLGLQDAALKLGYRPSPLLSLHMDLHAFRTSAQGSLSSQRLGEEVDTWVRYRFRRYLHLELGYCFVEAGPAMEKLNRLQGSGQFGWVMTSLRF